MDARGDDGRHTGGVGLRLPGHLRRQPALTADTEVVERVTTPRGELVLRRAGEHLEVISNGVFLMDTRDGRSERLLARAGDRRRDRGGDRRLARDAPVSAAPDPDYERRLRRFGADVEMLEIDVAPEGATRAAPDVVYLARA